MITSYNFDCKKVFKTIRNDRVLFRSNDVIGDEVKKSQCLITMYHEYSKFDYRYV